MIDKDYLKGLLQNILNKQFSSVNRRKIIEFPNRLNVCCPCCGDSKSEYKKRGNLYLDDLFYVCFNCDIKMPLDKLCKKFNEQIDPQKKLDIINHLDSIANYSTYESDFSDIKLDNLLDIKDLENLFNVKNNTPIFDFKPIVKNGGIYKYLVDRGIPDVLHRNIYQAKLSKGDEGFEHIIVLLNRKGDKVLGLQIRNLKEGKRRFFLIYNWESLFKWINGEDVEIDMHQCVMYNKLSYYFNILNVDFSDRITVFEGYIDSLFYPNSIGIVGVNTDMSFLEKSGLDIQYFFDNDSAGFKKSEEKLKSGFSVFLWKKLFDDIVSKKKSSDPYDLYNRISKVKDLNKLNSLSTNSYSKLKLFNFFSQDIMDIKYFPKAKKIIKKAKDYSFKFKQNDF